MKKLISTIIIAALLAMIPAGASAATSDYNMAKAYAAKHHATIEKVITISQGGYKGKVKGSRYTVRYPKKAKKGKTVTVYMVEKRGDIVAMVCMGVVK